MKKPSAFDRTETLLEISPSLDEFLEKLRGIDIENLGLVLREESPKEFGPIFKKLEQLQSKLGDLLSTWKSVEWEQNVGDSAHDTWKAIGRYADLMHKSPKRKD